MNITNIKEKFSGKEWQMVQDYSTGRLNNLTWYDIAVFYGIKPEGNPDQRRKGANDVWRKYLRLLENESNLEEVSNSTPKILTLDIETSYNIVRSFHIGSKVFLPHDSIIQERKIITVAYKWLGEEDVTVLQWDENQDDKTLVEELIKVMNEADEIVGHNINAYDIPFILARAIYHRIPALARYKTFDTYKVASKKFKFNNNKLDYIANLFGYGRKVQHRGMELWDDIILRKDPKAMDEMIEYNVHDVVLTENIYKDLRQYTEAKVHHAVLNGFEKHTCPTCGDSENITLLKTFVTPAGTKSRLMGCSCGTQFKLSETVYSKTYGTRD